MPFKNIIVFITASAVMLFFIFCPSLAVSSAYNHLNIWFNSIVPSVFPFIICISLMESIGIPSPQGKFTNFLCRSLFDLPADVIMPVFISLLSGFPMGTRIAASLYKTGRINSDELQRLLCFINTPSPVFTICVVGTGLLMTPVYGRLILFSCLASAFFTAVVFRFYYTNTPSKTLKTHASSLRTDAISSSVSAILKIGAYVIFFGIINDMLIYLPKAGHIFTLFTEMTSASSAISSLSVPMRIKVSILAFMLSFGGICMQVQIFSHLKEISFNKTVYTVSLILKAVSSSLIAYLFYPFFEYGNLSYVSGSYAHSFLYSGGIPLFYITIPSALVISYLCIKKRQV